MAWNDNAIIMSDVSENNALSFRGVCDGTMTASTTVIVASDLAGFGDDFFNTKYYIGILKNANSVGNAPESEYQVILDYVSATGTFTVAGFSAEVESGDGVGIFHRAFMASIINVTGSAAAADVLSGKGFLTVLGDYSTGTLATRTLTASSGTVTAGYYAATSLSAVDADLVVGNIKTGVNIFGVVGTYDTEASCAVVAARMRTGDIAFVNATKITGTGTQVLTASTESVSAGYYAATTLSTIDADLAVGNIKTGVVIFGFTGTYDVEATNPVVAARMKTGDVAFVNGAKITGTGTQVLTASTESVSAGYYAATTLSTIDSNLAVGNIKTGAKVFGFTGTYDTEGSNPVVAARMKTGDVAFVNGSKITGTGTQVLTASTESVSAGYYAATTLSTIDADLAVGNIKTGVVVFGFTGTYDTEASCAVTAGRMRTGDIAFVNGSKITGTGTKTMVPANDTVAAGYYEATTLHAVDLDLVTGNIKYGITIFGISGAASVQDISDADAIEAEVDLGKKFYSITGGVKIGTRI